MAVSGLSNRILLGVCVSLCALTTFASGAKAFTEPGITGTLSDFVNCPVERLMNLGGGSCFHISTRSGSVQIGSATVPISVPGDSFDLGYHLEGVEGPAFAPPHGILGGPVQPVPGGLIGTVGNVQLTGVTSRLEWARTIAPSSTFGVVAFCSQSPGVTVSLCNALTGSIGTAATLVAKIHLMSPFLGANCYIGSATNPIVLSLTTGTTSPPPPAHPIHGKPQELLVHFGTPLEKLGEQALGLTLVSNSFAVPAATGCGTTGGSLVDASINHKLGLPSPPGRNAIVINADTEVALASVVLAHGWTGE